MAENLLWPTKLKKPPKLLIDPSVMFNEDIFGQNHPLVNIFGSDTTHVRYLGLVTNGFMIGFITNVYDSDPEVEYKTITLPFQDISTKILEYRCHGWWASSMDILSTPNRTEVKTNLKYPTTVMAIPSRYISDNKPISDNKSLFKMEGDDLEDSGSGPQFSSNRAYYGITYNMDNMAGDAFNLKIDFPDMFKYFLMGASTLAIETVVKVNVISATDPDGFKIGVVSS